MKRSTIRFTRMGVYLAILWTLLNTVKAQTGAALNLSALSPADYITLPSAISTNSLVGGNKITVEAWVRPLTTTGFASIIGNYSSPNNQLQFLLRRTTNYYEFFVGTGNSSAFTGVATLAGVVSTSNWQHLAGVYDGTVIAIYLNGVLSGTASASHVFAPTTNSLLIGTNSLSQNFDGYIDEVRIWNTNRTACEINTYRNCEIAGSAPNLVANYHFNQGNAGGNNAAITTLTDASSNAFNGQLSFFTLNGGTSNWIGVGAVVSGSTTPLPPPSVSFNANPGLVVCNAGSALVLSGSGASTYTWSGGISNGVSFTVNPPASYTVTGTASTGCTNTAVANVSLGACNPAAALNFTPSGTINKVVLPSAISSASLVGGNKITVESWVKPTSVSGFGCIVGNYYNPSNQLQFMLRRTGNYYEFFVGTGNGISYTGANTAPGTATLNTWQHVAGTYNGTIISVYINGVLSATSAASYIMSTTTNSIVIGTNGLNEHFSGDIDEIRIWKTTRTQCEINTFKDCEIPTNASGLVANYHFNQGFSGAYNPTETTLSDASGNGYNGALSNFSLTGMASNWTFPGGVVSGFNTPLAPLTVGASASPAVMCAGNTATFSASGAGTYVWSGGVGTANPFLLSSANTNPAGLYTYTVTGTNNLTACSNTAVASVSINASPAITASSSASLICVGQSVTLTASGASTYTWANGANTSVIVVSPTVTTSYWVAGSGSVCSASTAISQLVSTCAGLSSETTSQNLKLRFYPNPAASQLTIVGAGTAKLRISTMLGEIVYEGLLSNQESVVDISELKAGMYVVKLENGQAGVFYKE